MTQSPPPAPTLAADHPQLQAPHLWPAAVVADALAVEPARGLDEGEVLRRRGMVGENRLPEKPRRPALLRFLDQFRSLLILILLGAAVLAGLVGDLKDTIVILVVLLINATIGFVQENKAERSLEALRDMLVATARVRRDGTPRIVEAAELVPGDVVLLEAGDRIPADGRFLVAESVEVDESALTGESQAVAKDTTPVGAAPGEQVPLADRTGMGHMNTALTRGRAELLVTATGMRTAVGAIAELLRSGEEPKSPLQVQLDSVGKRIALIGGIAIAVYATIALLRGESLGELALSAVALAVATVPEGLPAVLALTLALGVARMARRGAIVKRLASVETLGSATVICSDKTGTLTLNQMTARALSFAGRRVRIDGEGYAPRGALVDEATGQPAQDVHTLLAPLVLCSDATLSPGTDSRPGIVGDPTEGALVVAAAKSGISALTLRTAYPRIAELPFDSARKFMATVHDEGGRARVYLKGAPDVLLTRSTAVLTAEGVRELDADERERLTDDISALASRGLRILAAATTLVDDLPAGGDQAAANALAERLTGLTLLGLVGIADPPRPQVKDAIALASQAGVSVKMITGDHRDTAAAIARELGIGGAVVTGAELDRMTPAELSERVEDIGVFARVAPEHKVAIVSALTARGHVAAMTGDGVNDAAALRSAHMGVAMGITGTEVTKEAGDMILTDDDFTTIVASVREGRSIYDNVVKFVRFQLSTNIGAILSFLGATVAGLAAPLTAIQVLWVNIIMDGPPAMALGVDPARPGLMDEPPRRSTERILNRTRLIRMFRAGAVMATGTLSVLALADGAFGAPVAATMAFTTFVLFQFFNALNARAERETVFTRHLFTNRWLWVSFGTVIVLQVLVVHVPVLQRLFDTTALTATQWLICTMVAASVLVVEEAIKLARRVTTRR
ncbi:HAD family hydrolase [Blastococcus sp. KM273129]|nr:HAD family hydrolase [Blastococcus sp. KM273129]